MSSDTGAPSSDPPGTTPDGRVPPGAMRVSDTERNSAIEALGEHLAAGRITLDEYGDRSAKVTVAKTAADLTDLFDDLPAPHPVLPSGGAMPAPAPGRPVAAVPIPGAAAGGPPAVPDDRSAAQKIVGAAAAASVFVALALFFITGLWYWFLLIPAISAIAGSIWGPDWKESGGRDGRRQIRDGHADRRQIHDERRQIRNDRRRGRWDPEA